MAAGEAVERRDDIDQYGRGDRDPVTGLYAWYDLPPGALDVGSGDDITLLAILDEWPLVEFDFTHILHIDLEASLRSMTWRRFSLLLAGLFGSEHSLLRTRFRPDKTPEEGSHE